MMLLWYCYGAVMVLLWCCYGAVMVLLWYCFKLCLEGLCKSHYKFHSIWPISVTRHIRNTLQVH